MNEDKGTKEFKKLIHNSCTSLFLTDETQNGERYEIMSSDFGCSLNGILEYYKDENLKEEFNFGKLTSIDIENLFDKYKIKRESIISFSYSSGMMGIRDEIVQIEIDDYFLVVEGTDDYFDDIIILGYFKKKFEAQGIKKLITEFFRGTVLESRGLHEETIPEIAVYSKHIDLDYLRTHLSTYFLDDYWYNFRKKLYNYSKMSGKEKDDLLLRFFPFNKREKINIDAFNNILLFYKDRDENFFNSEPAKQEFNLLIDTYLILNVTYV